MTPPIPPAPSTTSAAAARLQYVYQSEGKGNQYAPTGRVDFNLSDKHRLSGSYMWQRFTSLPDLLNNADSTFPGLTNIGSQNSYRTTGSVGLRSTLSANVVNDVRGGWQWSPNEFFSNVTADQFADQDGYALTFANVNNAAFITGFSPVTNPAPRNTTTWSIENTLNWLKGSHSVSMGGGYAGVFNRGNSYNPVTSITARLRHQHGSGRQHHVRGRELPLGHRSAVGRSPRHVRDSHRPGVVDPWHGTARFGYRAVRLQRRPRAQVPAVQLRRVPLRFVAGDAGVDPQRGYPMGCAPALHAGGQYLVAGDD